MDQLQQGDGSARDVAANSLQPPRPMCAGGGGTGPRPPRRPCPALHSSVMVMLPCLTFVIHLGDNWDECFHVRAQLYVTAVVIEQSLNGQLGLHAVPPSHLTLPVIDWQIREDIYIQPSPQRATEPYQTICQRRSSSQVRTNNVHYNVHSKLGVYIICSCLMINLRIYNFTDQCVKTMK